MELHNQTDYVIISSAPCSPPLDVAATNIDSSSFFLSWRSPPSEDHNGIIRHYIINITEENTGGMFQIQTFEMHTLLNSLHPFYNYTCIVTAVTVENGPYSMEILTTTLQDSKYSKTMGTLLYCFFIQHNGIFGCNTIVSCVLLFFYHLSSYRSTSEPPGGARNFNVIAIKLGSSTDGEQEWNHSWLHHQRYNSQDRGDFSVVFRY